MAKKVINVGITANDSTGDPLRAAGKIINDNFTELYNALGGENGAPLSIVSKVIAGKGIAVSSETGDILVTNKIATQEEVGGIRIGLGINVDQDGIASVQVYELPKASNTILGGIKVGDRLSIDANGVLSADPGAYTLPKATASVLGGVKIGNGLEIDTAGVASVNFGAYSLPVASGSQLGAVKIGSRLTITDGVLSADIQTIGQVDRLTASSQTLILDSTGRLSYPGNNVHQQSSRVVIPPNVDTVIYSTNGEYVRAIKMFILVEKFTNTYESQACELIATVDEAQNQIYVSVYGVTYTGTNPIATFDGQYSLATNNFEITATPVSGVDTLNVRVQTTELNGTD
jgi:hypothetical protein